MEGRNWLLVHEDDTAFSDPAVLEVLHAELHRGSAPTRAAILTLLASSYAPATLGHVREELDALDVAPAGDLANHLRTTAAALCDTHLRRGTVPEQHVSWCCGLAPAADLQVQCRKAAKEPTDDRP